MNFNPAGPEGQKSAYVSAWTAAEAWPALVKILLESGMTVKPRNLVCYELLDVTYRIQNAYSCTFINAPRRLSHRFSVAEWLWIWFGHDDVKTISRYNKKIVEFSDNGVDFNGAYGKSLVPQWPRIVDTLKRDPDSRQAVIQVYKPPTGPTKDVPCTISLQFLVRNSRIETIVNMRSSDVWLGLPYDLFNFAMTANLLAAELQLELGSINMHLGSSHLYDVNRRDAIAAVSAVTEPLTLPQLPSLPPAWLDEVLKTGITAKVPAKPWTHFAEILAGSVHTIQQELRELQTWTPKS